MALALSLDAGVSASPRDELLRLVPDDMTFCVVMQDLREKSKGAAESVFGAQLAQMPFIQAKAKSPEILKLLEVQQQVLKELDLTPQQIRDDLIGDAVVFAYKQGPPDKPGQERGLFLVWARDKTLLAKVIDRVNAMQTKTGELKEVRAHEREKQTYHERIKNNRSDGEFYFVRDNLLVFSPQQAVLESIIDRDRTAGPVEKKPPFWSKMLGSLGLDKSLIAVLINPRVFDDDLNTQEKSANGADKAFLTEFRKYWQACDGLGVFADFAEHFEFGLALQVRKDAIPESGRRFFEQLGKPSSLWKVIPDDALFAVAARTDLALLADVFSAFAEPGKMKEVEKALGDSVGKFLPAEAKLDVLFKGVGPDWGFWAFAPEASDKTWVPQAILAVKLQKNREGKIAETTLGTAIPFLLRLAQVGSKDPFRFETVKHDKVEISVLANDTLFPAGFKPSFAIKEGFLVFAASPETIKRFAAPAMGKENPSTETPFLRVSGAAWRKYLATHGSEVAGFLAKTTGAQPKEIAGQIDDVVANLKPFDKLELVARSKADQTTIAIRLLMKRGE
jgi:hypothetical protein